MNTTLNTAAQANLKVALNYYDAMQVKDFDTMASYLGDNICLISPLAEINEKEEVLTAELSRLVHRNQWGLEVSPAEFISAIPDAFKADLDAYLVWQITWQHQLHLGESIWKDSDIAAHTIYVGFAPYIGEPHEDKYQELADGSGV